MPTISYAPIEPVERLMIFIDGGYFRKVFKDLFGDDNIDWQKLKNLFQEIYKRSLTPFQADLIRIYYYDGIVNEEDKEHKSQKEYLDDIRLKEKYTVRLGEAIRGKGGLRQKGVDILMAIDSLTKAYENHYDVAMFILGDRDFIPLITAVKNAGKKTLGVCYEGDVVSELFMEFDMRNCPTEKVLKEYHRK